MRHSQGILVTFEGIDGSGKSTQIRLLVERLKAAGRSVAVFREPGGTALSERVRAILLDPALQIHPFPELLLFSSARAQLVEERIRPELARGTIVLCDRFYDSTTAYQGAGRRVADLAWVEEFNRHVTGGLIPDRTYLLAIEPDAAVGRRRGRAEEDDRMESSDSDFYRRVVGAYDALAERESRFMRLDGHRPVEDLHEEIWADFAVQLSSKEDNAGGTAA